MIIYKGNKSQVEVTPDGDNPKIVYRFFDDKKTYRTNYLEYSHAVLEESTPEEIDAYCETMLFWDRVID